MDDWQSQITETQEEKFSPTFDLQWVRHVFLAVHGYKHSAYLLHFYPDDQSSIQSQKFWKFELF